MPVILSVKSDIDALSRNLTAAADQQLPFATAQAVTGIARRIAAAEQHNFADVLDKPTPFTVNSVGVRGARKADPVAVVYLKDIAAAYLEPFGFGGRHALNGKRGLLVPKKAGVDQYGNLPRTAMAALKGKPGVFVGTIRFRKSGQVVSGVWQRPQAGKRRTKLSRAASPHSKVERVGGKYGTKGALKDVLGVKTGLTLLIRFEDPLPVRTRLDWQGKAEAVVSSSVQPEFDKAMRQALATAK